MRNSVFVLLVITLTPQHGIAQTFPLTKDGLISFSEIIEADSLGKFDLLINAGKWLSEVKSEEIVEINGDSSKGSLTAKSSFLVYAQSGVLKKVSGRISYSISIDVKTNKYRYSFTDFIFHYYKADRTYNIVENGKTKKLEDTHAAGWQELWNRHRVYTQRKMSENIELLTLIMKDRPTMIIMEKEKAKKIEW